MHPSVKTWPELIVAYYNINTRREAASGAVDSVCEYICVWVCLCVREGRSLWCSARCRLVISEEKTDTADQRV